MSDARFGPAQPDAILQPAGICQSLLPPLAPAASSTLDSIQCHSISQCNAHAAAYRRVSSVKRPLFPAGATRVKCPTCNRSVHQGFAREYGTSVSRAFIHGFHFSVTLLSLIHWTSPPGADFVFWKPLSVDAIQLSPLFDYHIYNSYHWSRRWLYRLCNFSIWTFFKNYKPPLSE